MYKLYITLFPWTSTWHWRAGPLLESKSPTSDAEWHLLLNVEVDQPSKKNCFGSTSTCQHVLKWQDKYVSEDGQHLTPKTLCNQNNNLNRAQNLYNVIKTKCGFWSCSLCVCVSRIHHLTILALSFGLCHHSLLLSFFPNVSMASSFFLVMKCRLLCIHRRWNIYMS